MSSVILEAHDLTKEYRHTVALDHIDLKIEKGKIYGFIGQNGAGKTWIFALGQAFFSLSVAGNGTLIYGSYLSDGENIPAAAGRVAFFDTLAAMLAALVIIPAMATTGAQLNTGGPGLLFIFLPNLMKSMPGGALIAIVFFVAVFFAGLTSLINLYEAPIATVQEKFHLGRVAACGVIGVIGVVVSLLIQGIRSILLIRLIRNISVIWRKGCLLKCL